MERVQEILDLSATPHFTTLQKSLCQIKSLYYRLTFKKTVILFYDSEAIHRLIREDIQANSIIPVRSWNNDIIVGTYSQEMDLHLNGTVYPRRQIVENKFSIIKRKFSGDLKARVFLIQMKEIITKRLSITSTDT